MVIKDLMIVLLSGDTQKDSREKAVVFNPYNSSKDSKVSSDDTNYNENVLFYIFFFSFAESTSLLLVNSLVAFGCKSIIHLFHISTTVKWSSIQSAHEIGTQKFNVFFQKVSNL